MNETIFVIKREAFDKKIVHHIIDDISSHFLILDSKTIILDDPIISMMRDWDWKNNWTVPPSSRIRKLFFHSESGKSKILLCCIIDGHDDAIKLGSRLKGGNPIPSLCAEGTIRKKYCRLVEKEVSTVKLDGKEFLTVQYKNKSAFPPNFIHTPDNIEEFLIYKKLFFDKIPYQN